MGPRRLDQVDTAGFVGHQRLDHVDMKKGQAWLCIGEDFFCGCCPLGHEWRVVLEVFGRPAIGGSLEKF